MKLSSSIALGTTTMTTAIANRQASRFTRAYTAIEVMLSIVVLGIGAAGVMSMQKASIQANNDARMLDIGNSIAREWVERIRRDGMTWTQPDENSSTENWSTNTNLINQIGAKAGDLKFDKLDLPSAGPSTGLAEGYSRAFDILGRDVSVAAGYNANAVFCTEVRGDWILQDQLLRVSVRVRWLQQMFTAPPGGGSSFCTASDDADSAPAAYHFVYATTAVRRTPGT